MRDMNKAVVVIGMPILLATSGGVVAQQSGKQVYKAVCVACHASGVDKAPKFGDRKDWGGRIREGQVVLTAEGLVGEGKMPPRGGKPELTTAEFANAVVFMARAAGATWKDPDAQMVDRIAAQEKKLLDRRKAKKS